VTRLQLSSDGSQWDQRLQSLPNPHLLQSWTWGDLKSHYGWSASRFTWLDESDELVAAAQVLQRETRSPFGANPRVLYVPKGPILDWSDESLRRTVLTDLMHIARDRGAIFIKIDPNVPLGTDFPGEPEASKDPLGGAVRELLAQLGWRYSQEQIQFRNTMTIDLRPPEKKLLADMKQKTRYNVRLAGRKGVEVELATKEELGELYRIYAETAIRDDFAIRDRKYYLTVWGTFMDRGLAQPLIARVRGEPVAGLIAFRFGQTAWYLYGMSRDVHRDKMPNYLLQWEAIRWAKRQGCTTYDLWGAPDEASEQDPMWGVYRFKAGLGAQVLSTIGAWDYPARPAWYWLYSIALPRFMAILRARGRAQTRGDLS
jgi:peptidoglycan pentaglycine glycine transferase (the first glycine)